jgi:hypothetical protein
MGGEVFIAAWVVNGVVLASAEGDVRGEPPAAARYDGASFGAPIMDIVTLLEAETREMPPWRAP